MSRTRTRRSVALILASAVCTAAALAMVQTRTVSAALLTVTTSADPASGDCNLGTGSLRHCIQRAEALGGSNVIVFDAATNGAPIVLAAGLGELHIHSTANTLSIQGNGRTSTIIDGNSAGASQRVFEVDAGASVSFSHLTIRNGAPVDSSGAGILDAGNISVTDVLMSHNSSTATLAGMLGGGGISGAAGAKVTVTGSTFDSNSVVATDAEGGAIQVCCTNTTLSISGSTFTSNSVSTTSIVKLVSLGLAKGGAVASGTGVGSLATITNSTFTGNSSSVGGSVGVGQASAGAVLNSGTSMVVTGSVFRHNTVASGGEGGAIDNCCGVSTAAVLQVLNSLFDGNTVTGLLTPAGGGVATSSAGVTSITGSTFTGNSVTGVGAFGGGVSDGSNATLSMSNSTLVGNVVSTPPPLPSAVAAVPGLGFGGNIGVGNRLDVQTPPLAALLNLTVDGGVAGTGPNIGLGAGRGLVMGNTIVAGSPGSNCSLGLLATVTDKGHNLEDSATSTCGLAGANADLLGADAKLGPLQDNGGLTPTQALLPGSAAIDKGDNAICAALPVNSVDQRGLPRFPTGDPVCDVGAFEVQPQAPAPTPTVTAVIAVPKTGTAPPSRPNDQALWLLGGAASLLAGIGAATRRRRRT